MHSDSELLSREQLSKFIGDRIKLVRSDKGISQAELARLCGKDRQHIELIENAKVSPNIYTIYLIAYCLEIEVGKLFIQDI